MKKIIVIVTSMFLLTACGNSSTTTETQSSIESSTSSSVEDKALTLVHGKNTTQAGEVVQYVEDLLIKNPNLGAENAISLNYADATNSDGTTTYALFLVTNRTADRIEQNFDFTVNWSYDGTVIYENQKVLYEPDEYGVLEPDTTAIIFLPLPAESVDVVKNMTDNSKISLSISDLAYVE